MDITKIESADQLLSIREAIQDPKIRRYTDKQKFIMYQAYNDINKLYGRGAIKDSCSACLTVKVIPQLYRWLNYYDNQKPKELSIEELRIKLDNLKIPYHHKHKAPKLMELLNENTNHG